MTAIAGFVKDKRVWIDGDSAGVGTNYSLELRADEKVFQNGPFLFGFTSSFRMGQLLRYSFDPPPRPADMDVYKFMATIFIDAVRKCLKDGGFAKKNNEVESGGTFLVGYAGRLFKVDDDFQVGESLNGYDACGCADDIICGAFYVINDMYHVELAPNTLISLALSAAEHHSCGVRSPFVIKHLETQEEK